MSATQDFDLQRVQKLRKAALLVGLIGVVGLAFVSRSIGGETVLHEGLEAFGLGLIVVCIVGRAWCSLYIGGRKKAEIVDPGPHSISPNPGAQTGSVTLASVFLLLTVAVFYATVKREEAWLSGAFGQTYADYCARTPRFGPDFSKWRDADSLEVRPQFFLTTLRDGLVFLLAVPLFESVEHLQDMGWLAALVRLP